MTKTELTTTIADAITEVESISGRPAPEITPRLNPFLDLGWDSLLGIEAAVVLEEKLGFELPDESIFVTTGAKPRARTVAEIVKRVEELQRSEGAA